MADKRTNFKVVLRRPTRIRKSIAKLNDGDDGWLDRGTELTVSKVFSGPSYQDSLGWVSDQWLHVKDVGYLWAGGCADSVFRNEDMDCGMMMHDYSGKGVRVAVIDGAFNLDKCRFEVKKENLFCRDAEMSPGKDWKELKDEMNVRDRGIHGTQCAELIHHMAPDVELFLCAIEPELTDDILSSRVENLLKAIRWIKAKTPKVDVVSVSLFQLISDLDLKNEKLKVLLVELSFELKSLGGTLFVSSVGNSLLSSKKSRIWPSYYGKGNDDCLAIGAYLKKSGHRYFYKSFVNDGISFLAPGRNFSEYTSFPLARFGNTSAACAYTVGVFAMLGDKGADHTTKIIHSNKININQLPKMLVSEGDYRTKNYPYLDLHKYLSRELLLIT